MALINIATAPVVSVAPESTVLEAVRLMNDRRIGAVVVLRADRLEGVFSERDVMTRLVAPGRDAAKTPISEVMTRDVVTATTDTSPGTALRILIEKHIRHLPVIDADRRVIAMVSLRDLLRHRIDDLSQQLDSVVNYFTADGIGG
jgi:CBS domain-containing protein